MSLTVAGTFGSLPEASIAFSSLASAGFNPVAGFNMNTPGTADGMAPSAYRVLVPEDEAQAARTFLVELLRELSSGVGSCAEEGSLTDETSLDAQIGEQGPSTLFGRLRKIVPLLIIVAFAAWIAMIWLLPRMR